MTAPTVAVVGATGVVGRELLAVLEQRAFPLRSLRLLASPRSAGKRLPFKGQDLAVEPLGREALRGCDLALFAAGAEVSRSAVPWAVEGGALAVDNSSAFRLDPSVPLVVPEVNLEAARAHRGIVANPNCSTILLCLALAPLERAFGILRVVVSTYQAASGAGMRGMEELLASTRAALEGRDAPPAALPRRLAFNVFPQVDAFQESGYTREEDKMEQETRKILGREALRVEATCVRVPVLRCHSEAVSVELASPATPGEAEAALARAPGLALCPPTAGGYPTPLECTGRDEVAVGRVRASRVFDPGLAFWLVGDQLRKGAALNAVQIAEGLLLAGTVR